MAGPDNTQFAVAVHVLTFLAAVQDGDRATSEMLADSANASSVYVRRVLGPLREAGVVRSTPGVQGGWELARPAGSIRLDEVWSAVHGTRQQVLGLHGPSADCLVGRNIRGVLDRIDADASSALRSALQRRTVADVLAEAESSAGERIVVPALGR